MIKRSFIYSASIFCITALLIFSGGFSALYSQDSGDRYAIIVGGLGGEPQYTSAFAQYLHDTRSALVDVCGFNPENVIVLAERTVAEKEFIDEISTAENIRVAFATLSGKAVESDQFYLFLFGHGSFNGTNAMLNIPRKDLTAEDYASLLDETGAGTTVLVNTASASGPFIRTASAPGRVVITATQSEGQRNVTQFPAAFIEGMKEMSADLDRNGDLSLTEIFSYAVQMTDKFYENQESLPTEHALLEDTGDARGYRAGELEENGEGRLAATLFLKRKFTPRISSETDSVFLKLIEEQRQLETAVAELKQKKQELSEDEYYGQLESLMLRLAEVADKLEKYKKTG